MGTDVTPTIKNEVVENDYLIKRRERIQENIMRDLKVAKESRRVKFYTVRSKWITKEFENNLATEGLKIEHRSKIATRISW